MKSIDYMEKKIKKVLYTNIIFFILKILMTFSQSFMIMVLTKDKILGLMTMFANVNHFRCF